MKHPNMPNPTLRIGILTYHFSDNFGALMQAYGLQTWLKAQGYQAEFVNYRPSHVEAGGSLSDVIKVKGAKAKAKIIYLRLSALRNQLFGNRDQHAMLQKFQSQNLGVTSAPLGDEAAVGEWLNTPEGRFDMLVCGSDQIWAPSQQRGIDPVYYLHIPQGAQGARRISYAPSFGKATLDKAYEAEVAGYLQDMDGLSAREQSGVEIVSRLSGKPTAYVPDPTILLGDFRPLAAQAKEVGEGHVFCYALRTGQGIRDVAQLAAETTGGRILSPHNPHRRWKEIGETIYPSPEAWVAHVERAAFVVSNSFHGTVFSILFRKPFLSVALPGAKASLNERSANLLRSLGLQDRLVDASDMVNVRRRMAEPIDWEAVQERLSAMQEAGRNYLRQELESLRR